MEKPKLLLVADTYYPKVDGTMIFMNEFIKRTKNDFDLHLLVPDLGERKGERVTYLNISKRFAVSGYPTIKLSLKNLNRIKKEIKAADIVFIQGPALASYLSIFFGKRYKKRTVFYTHTLAWELFEKFLPHLLSRISFNLIKRISVFFYNRCDEIFVPYHELRDYLKKQGVKTKINVARLGVDIEKFSPAKDKKSYKKKLEIDPEKKVIGYVGRISKEKNITLLLKAFGHLKERNDVYLLVVGDGPEDQIKEFKNTENCMITGFVNNVEQYLKAMDVFVMPSLTETTSLATLEAMSCGIPVIVTKVGFIKSYVIKNYNGIFFPRNDAKMLAMKISKLLDHEETRTKLGKNARKTVAYSFSWERSINRIKRLLKNNVNHS